MDEYLKSSLLKAISDHLDNLEQGVSAARRLNDTDLYSRTGPGDVYTRTSAFTLKTASKE
jgi:hypothetical protein